METLMQRRSKALNWWALLRHYERDKFALDHTGRDRNTLTGREVEEIYKLHGDGEA